MDFKYKKLRGRIVEKYGTFLKFSEVIGLSMTAISNKLHGKTQFSQDDIIRWCEALDIPIEDSIPYFFK